MNTEEAIKVLKEIHRDKNYSWDKFVYVNARTKGIVTCNVEGHGDFLALYDSLRKGHGCRFCGYQTARVSKSYTTDEFVKLGRERNTDMRGDTYLYDKTLYVNRETRVTITCRIHGDFSVSPANHLNNFTGCKECGKIKAHSKFLKPVEQLKEEISKILDPEKYTLVNTDNYTSNKSYVTMNCKEHGDWITKPNWILSRGTGCVKCTNSGISRGETELLEYIKSLGFTDIEPGGRRIIPPLEMDMVLESKKIAFEYNGLYFHSEAMGKTAEYHFDKTVLAKRKGYRLIQIYEDEWVHNKDLVKIKIAHILGVNPGKKLYARKLFLDRVSFNEAKTFFETNHIQGSPPNHKICYGLFEDGVLVAAMSFGPLRFNVENAPENAYELYRYATSKVYYVIGGFSRLLKNFVRDNNDIGKIYSFSDRRWSVGEVYKNNGFSYIGYTKPSYDYTDNQARRYNRQNFMKQRMPELVKKGIFKSFDPDKTEVENCKDNNLYRIWNCGMDKWELDLSRSI